MHTYPYPRPALTADIVLFGVSDEGEALRVLLVTRKNEPFQGMRAFPGGFVNVSDDGDQGEPLIDAARRELKEETGLVVRGLHVIGLASAPGRDPRGRVISVIHTGIVRLAEVFPQAGMVRPRRGDGACLRPRGNSAQRALLAEFQPRRARERALAPQASPHLRYRTSRLLDACQSVVPRGR